MEIEEVYRTMRQHQCRLLDSITEIVYTSGNMRGIPQWRDRNRLYKLRDTFMKEEYLLTIKDFQFLESLCYKYKV